MKFNLDENAKFVQILSPASYSAAAEVFTTGLNTQGAEEALAIVDAGVINGTIAIRIQESNDNAVTDPYVDVVTAANGFSTTILVSTNTGLPGLVFGRLDLTHRKPWLRFGYTVGTSSAIFAIELILNELKYRPYQSGQGEAGYPLAGATSAGRAFQV
jgi:hypothetical protein